MILRKAKGFTLIELIIVIVISGIVVAGAGSLLLQGTKAYLAGRSDINTTWQANMAIERITREVRSLLVITNASSSEFIFKDENGNTVDYKVESNQLMRNTQALATNIQDAVFTYYDGTGEVTTSPGLIRYIKISLNVIYEKIISNISTTIALWNVK